MVRTRRSPRNQAILWKLLGPPDRKSPVGDEVSRLETILRRPDLNARTRRQLERDLQRAKVRKLVRNNEEDPR